MSILIDKNTRVIVQGFTGRQGRTGKWKRHLTCLFPGERLTMDGQAGRSTRDGNCQVLNKIRNLIQVKLI
jgi:succinyl-CoA synthetase alpha subunit